MRLCKIVLRFKYPKRVEKEKFPAINIFSVEDEKMRKRGREKINKRKMSKLISIALENQTHK